MTYYFRQNGAHGSAVAAAIPVSRLPKYTWHWRSILTGYFPKATSADPAVSRALAELRAMTDQELSDVGLGRSDLTPEGLKQAARRRAVQQAAIK
jgi:Domain of unknown function (DUF1127)